MDSQHGRSTDGVTDLSWAYLGVNALILGGAAALGWRLRRSSSQRFAWVLFAASVVIALRTLLHARPEYEQHLLALSSDYIYFAAWEAPVAALVGFALAGRLPTPWLRVVLVMVLVMCSPVFLWNSLAPCLQPEYRMGANIDHDNVCRQTTSYSCGPAAAVTVLRHYGRDVTEGEMARLSLLRRNEGVTILELCRGLNVALRGTRHAARIQRLGLRDLAAAEMPVLAEVRRSATAEHCVALLEMQDDLLVVADPAYGRRIYDIESFAEEWTGLIIEVSPGTRAVGTLGRAAPATDASHDSRLAARTTESVR
jgi:predicted double-glycine peptidase